MRSLFIVASKILGILFAYWLLTGLVGVVTSIEHIEEFGGFVVFRAVFSLLVTFIFAWLLLLKTNSMAEYLGLHDDAPFSMNLSSDSILKIGVILIGIYVFSAKIGSFLSFIYKYVEKIKVPRSVFAPNWISTTEGIISTLDIIMRGLVLIFSLYLVFESSKVVNFIKKYDNRKLNKQVEQRADK